MTDNQTLRYVVTPTAESIMNAIQTVRDKNSVALFTGKAGVGKTAIIKHYLKTDTHARYLMVSPAMGKIRAMLRTMGHAIGVDLSKKSEYYMHEELDRWFRFSYFEDYENKYRGPYIIFDEIQYVHLNTLKQILDYNESAGLPIIMFGNQHALKQTKVEVAGFDQIEDRIRYFDQVTITRADIAAICDGWGIVDSDARHWILAYTSTRTVRKMTALVQHAIEAAGDNNVRVHHLNQTLTIMSGQKLAVEVMQSMKLISSDT